MITKRFAKKRLLGLAAAIMSIAALFLCWWMGIFLPNWIDWREKEFKYEDAQVLLENRRLSLQMDESMVFDTNLEWFVQDALSYDINCDGKKELILLVWKHGSYGKYRPIWVEHNDIRLEQHIFIYQWDETRDTKLSAVWMSSALGYEVSSIARGSKDRLIITDRAGVSMIWEWQDFGLKLVGEAQEKSVSFVCAGDNLMHMPILQFEDNGYDYLYENIKEKIEQADYASINQETIFVEDEGLVSDYPRFGTPIKVGDAIVNAGFDIVTLATNHVLDKGLYGIGVTTKFYEDTEDMIYLGVNPPNAAAMDNAESVHSEVSVKIVEKKGIRIALLNYTYGTNGISSPEEQPYLVERFRDEERMIEQLDYARMNADAVIVFAHWGTEYSEDVDEDQQYWSDLLLEHGVDVVVGTHPHVLQPYEMRTREDGHQMLVYYSLGNLISGQNREDCLVGGLAEFRLVKSPEGMISIEEYGVEKVVTQNREDGCTVYFANSVTVTNEN